MSTQDLELATATARGILANVDPAQLGDPTPCASWTVAELIDHIVGGQHFFKAGMTGEGMEAAGQLFSSGDYLQAFDDASKETIAVFSEDGAMQKMVTLPFGTFPGAAFYGLACTDTFQHAWDLAKATGQDTNLEPELAAQLLAQARVAIPDTFRGPEGAPFGQQTDAGTDAAPADQLAAFLGRSA